MMRPGWFLLALVVALAPLAARPHAVWAFQAEPNALDLMAEGKAETELGRYEAAIHAFTAIVSSPAVTPALRVEALIRLGIAQRSAGAHEDALRSFERAAKDPGLDQQTKALLVMAAGGVMSSQERWAEVWTQVSFVADRSRPQRPSLAVVWPGRVRRTAYSGQPIDIDFKDADLRDVLGIFARISGLNLVALPAVHGSVTVLADDEPWDACLDRILAATGYAYVLEDNVILVGAPDQLPTARRYSGQRIDVDYRDRNLDEALREMAAAGGLAIAFDPVLRGRITLKLNKVRWDHALATAAAMSGLDWTVADGTVTVRPGRPGRAR